MFIHKASCRNIAGGNAIDKRDSTDNTFRLCQRKPLKGAAPVKRILLTPLVPSIRVRQFLLPVRDTRRTGCLSRTSAPLTPARAPGKMLAPPHHCCLANSNTLIDWISGKDSDRHIGCKLDGLANRYPGTRPCNLGALAEKGTIISKMPTRLDRINNLSRHSSGHACVGVCCRQNSDARKWNRSPDLLCRQMQRDVSRRHAAISREMSELRADRPLDIAAFTHPASFLHATGG